MPRLAAGGACRPPRRILSPPPWPSASLHVFCPFKLGRAPRGSCFSPVPSLRLGHRLASPPRRAARSLLLLPHASGHRMGSSVHVCASPRRWQTNATILASSDLAQHLSNRCPSSPGRARIRPTIEIVSQLLVELGQLWRHIAQDWTIWAEFWRSNLPIAIQTLSGIDQCWSCFAKHWPTEANIWSARPSSANSGPSFVIL